MEASTAPRRYAMGKWIWGLLFTSFLLVITVSAPASLLGTVLARLSNGRITLANTMGTIWHGSANPLVYQHNGNRAVLHTVHWNITVIELFKGQLNTQIDWDDTAQTTPMLIHITPSQIELRQLFIPLPAMLLEEVSDYLQPAQLRGQVILKSDSLVLNRQGVFGRATADWLNAQSLLSNLAVLGNYRFTFLSNPNRVDIALDTLSGTLLLNGKGHFSSLSGLQFSGTAQAAAGGEEALLELLNHLGPQPQPGIHSFTLAQP